MKIYAVVNIDIVNSREISNRETFQKKLVEYISQINKEMKEYLLCDITITLGDEWQCVLKSPEKSYEYINKFQAFARSENVEIYAGVGIGTISTAVDMDSRFMDGRCFHLAREALTTAKNSNTYYNRCINSRDNRIYIKGEDSDACEREGSLLEIINGFIDNNETLKHRITQKQMEIIEMYEALGSYSNIIDANHNISRASISQKLNNSNYFLIKNNKRIIEECLKKLKGRDYVD